MANFLFNLFNHSKLGRDSLEDVIGIVGHQLRALGHEVLWDPDSPKTFLTHNMGYNVVVEGFTESSLSVLHEIHGKGGKFIILATEEPTPDGFNHGDQIEMIRRQRMFPAIKPYVSGILALVPGKHVTDWYSQVAPSAYVELGFAPTLLRIDPRIQPQFDFGFFGSYSERRQRICSKLAKRLRLSPKAVRIIANFPSQVERDAEMRNVKVVLQLRKFEKMGLVSSSRCNTALCLGRPVFGEPHTLVEPWGKIVHFSNTIESFYEEAFFILANWKHVYRKQLMAFKELLTPMKCIGEPLRQIGIE